MSAHKTHTAKFDKPLLFFDKEGILGTAFVQAFAKEYLCVLVSGQMPTLTQNIIHIPYKKRIPTIPNSQFSHFFLVYSGDRRLLDLLPAFIRKAQTDNTRIIFLLPSRFASEALVNGILQSHAAVTVVLLGDIFGLDRDLPNPVTHLLSLAKTGTIQLANNGLSPVYPVHKDDVIEILHRYVSHPTQDKQSGILYFLPPHPVSSLSVARALVRKEPLLHVDFYEETQKDAPFYQPPQYQSVFGTEYSYVSKLPHIAPDPEYVAESNEADALLQKPRHVPPIVKRVLFLLLLILLSLPLIPLSTAALGGVFLARAKTHLTEGNTQSARASFVAAGQFFSFAGDTLVGVVKPLDAVGMERVSGELVQTVQTGEDVSDIGVVGLDGLSHIQNILTQKSNDPEKELMDGLRDIKFGLTRFSQLRAENRIPKHYEKEVADIEKMSMMLTNTIEVLPTLLGMHGEKTYVVLFQNNMELRPGGGFIGSYGIAKVNKGQVSEFVIQDVYEADGQLSEHIEPPYALKRYLGASHWFLRDSNTDVEFPINAQKAANFLFLETGVKVDGVIAIDISFIRKLLGVLGPISIPTYNETVTEKNFFLLTESYAQQDFFPGSTQKKDFLSAVNTALTLSLQQKKDIPYFALAKTIVQSVAEKHVLFAVPDESVQKALTISQMSSSLTDAREVKEGTVDDFFGINESNLGANKVNYYIDRVLHHSVVLNNDGVATETAKITYTNRSTKDSAFGGEYKNYLRFILPEDVLLHKVTIHGIDQEIVPAIIDPAVYTAARFVPPQGLEVERTTQNGKTMYGFLVTIPQGQKKEVAITYSVLPQNLSKNQITAYRLRLFKQPGTDADPYSFSLTLPDNLKVLSKPASFRQNRNTLTTLTQLTEDRDITIALREEE